MYAAQPQQQAVTPQQAWQQSAEGVVRALPAS
jgi:hypothetical protein